MSVQTATLRIAPTTTSIPQRAGWRGWIALAVLMLPVLLASVDHTALNFALPQIALQLQPTSLQQLWMVDVYPLVLAGMLVTMGVLGDRFGRRRMLLIGATGFAAISALAAFAPSAGWLIAARAGMGVFGAVLMPATLSLIRGIFADRNQRRLAIAVWAAAFSAGGALGPVVGGFLLAHYSWGSVFLIAVPVLVPLLVLAPFLIPESRDPDPGRIDIPSILLSMATMVSVVYAVKEVAIEGVTSVDLGLFALGLALGALFVRRQLRSPQPLFDVRLFTVGVFTGALLVNLLSVVAFMGFEFFIAQHLQLVLGMSALESAFVLLPGVLAMMVAGLVIVPVSRRVSPRVLLPATLAVAAVGYALIAFVARDHALALPVIASVLIGTGIGMTETVSNELALSAAPAAKAGAASAVSETAYEVGAVLGTTILGGILTALYRAGLEPPAGIPQDAAAHASDTLAGAVHAAEQLGGPIGDALWHAATSAFDSGVTVTAVIGAVVVVLAALVAAVTLGRSRASHRK
ncbi:MAG TPA: MFS transporter [Microbacterium sp.]|uniref:MFS transporter n=1 Tax=Microbacterium sp. TaxID=51671 RepID=UPI002B478C85|nr:MFS transporter [Microbacterium sp.]HKT55274.1 MFS transporter [Microbacterium sp.]